MLFLETHDGAFDTLFEKADDAYLPLLEEWTLPLYESMFQHIVEPSTALEGCYNKLLPARQRNGEEIIEDHMERFRFARARR